MTSPARWVAWLLRGYQRGLSPLLPRICRFEPTCSEYARQAVLSHGLARGGWLAVRRLVRCHPLHPGGYDPPPVPLGQRDAGETTVRWKGERSLPRS
ncbi:MAG: membrane protein insertion efficiency factor YidD [Candidatus Rokubacteria bacterium]|nr:membrane protein insertion efficiency factor YidD [Candidatus Rokubacteria bacterium]